MPLFSNEKPNPTSNLQSTCSILCINPSTQESYKQGECPICNCKCNRVYYKEKVGEIKVELEKEERRGKTIEANQSRINAQEWLQNSFESGRLATETASKNLSTPKNGEAYLEDIHDTAVAKTMMRNAPSVVTTSYLKEKIVDNIVNAPGA